ncbi:MAG: hypothetical protein K8R23_19375 [Chthoniobacter sp.]|nr:hypothetical protein [Chthoniobacter sp.]
MSTTPPKDLFAVHDGDPIREWAALTRELETFQPSLLKQWKDEYECWKHHYQRFRDSEEKTLFTATDEGQSPKPSETVMRLHRRALLVIMQSGEQCSEHLRSLDLNGEEAQERLVWDRRLRTLLEALQENLEIWHPVNAERTEEERKLMFGGRK